MPLAPKSLDRRSLRRVFTNKLPLHYYYDDDDYYTSNLISAVCAMPRETRSVGKTVKVL
jgi:hypothetical protein